MEMKDLPDVRDWFVEGVMVKLWPRGTVGLGNPYLGNPYGADGGYRCISTLVDDISDDGALMVRTASVSRYPESRGISARFEYVSGGVQAFRDNFQEYCRLLRRPGTVRTVFPILGYVVLPLRRVFLVNLPSWYDFATDLAVNNFAVTPLVTLGPWFR